VLKIYPEMKTSSERSVATLGSLKVSFPVKDLSALGDQVAGAWEKSGLEPPDG
jgi:hypothetical protein